MPQQIACVTSSSAAVRVNVVWKFDSPRKTIAKAGHEQPLTVNQLFKAFLNIYESRASQRFLGGRCGLAVPRKEKHTKCAERCKRRKLEHEASADDTGQRSADPEAEPPRPSHRDVLIEQP